MTEKHVLSTLHLMPCQYCPDCDELLCKLISDIKGNFRGWCSSCKLVWLLTELPMCRQFVSNVNKKRNILSYLNYATFTTKFVLS